MKLGEASLITHVCVLIILLFKIIKL